MKPIIQYSVLIAIAFTLFVSCNQKKTTKDDLDTTDIAITKDSIYYDSYKIKDKDSAIKALKRYKDYIELVKKNLDSTKFSDIDDRLNYGSESFSKELIEILVSKKQMDNGNKVIDNEIDDTDRLFLMNAIRPKFCANREKIEGEFVTEIIYILQTEKIERTGTTYEHMYFDFTQPCPNGCPKGISNLVYPTISCDALK